MIDELFRGAPAFEHRAFMLDISRDRVPTVETLSWLIDVLAALRFNELQLYVEHTFAYRGHDVVWNEASPLTHDEIASIRDRATASGVELVANMNCFGHSERWLRHDQYRDRAECPDGFPRTDRNGHSPPTCFEPTAANAELAISLATEMLEAVGGTRIMIGGDEPFELGLGRSAAMAAEIGPDTLYRLHLQRIIEPFLARGIETMFWGDQFRTDRASVEWIPDGATCVLWNYEAPMDEPTWHSLWPDGLPDSLGLPPDAHLGFVAHSRLLIESGKPFWLACGTSSWNSLIGRNTKAAANIVDTANVGSAHGAAGFMLTDWGDNGHWQPLVVSLPSMVRAGMAAWSGSGNEVAVGPLIDELLGVAPGTGELLDRIGNLGDQVGGTTFNGTPIAARALNLRTPTFGAPDRAAVTDAIETIELAMAQFATAFTHGNRNEIIGAELDAICRVALYGLRQMAGHRLTVTDFDDVKANQRAAWLRSSRPGGLTDSLDKLRLPE